MTNRASDILVRVLDQGNGVYRIDDVQWYVGERTGVHLGQCDFVADLVECALARLGKVGSPSLWSGAADIMGNVMTVVMWVAQ